MRTRQVIIGTISLAILTTAGFRAAPNQAGAALDAKTPPAAAPALASGVSEVMKLFRGGTSADIIAGYVRNSPLSFYLSADNILFLQQQGLPEPVIMAMLQRYGELQRQTGMAARAAAPVPARAPAPQYQSYAAEYPAVSYPYVPPPSYPVYQPYYEPYYGEPFLYEPVLLQYVLLVSLRRPGVSLRHWPGGRNRPCRLCAGRICRAHRRWCKNWRRSQNWRQWRWRTYWRQRRRSRRRTPMNICAPFANCAVD